MHRSGAAVAVVAVLIAAMSVSAFARGRSGGGGRGSTGGHASSGGVSHGSHASRGHPGGARPHGVNLAPRPHYAGGTQVGVFIGAPLYAPLVYRYPYSDPYPYPAPGYYYSPPPTYIEQAPTPDYWYFCPEANAYYPYVQACPGGWQPVLPQPPG
jgi:hypothetical protein